ncbi:hypothetical protein MICAF_3680007 [Microcystis aeruginosa PCC 9807]|uniref:Uncharacterized protein n=2 Tax=Microcystis TaxID=1125 RepID=I4H847_MICAE|nr:hypothetical protein VL20_1320 [Microcystis panniformis FACHB-1757]CCI18221.1 hypothetical protein MICAF_3680007 [Microcystis aeruginosa PCC 9807]
MSFFELPLDNQDSPYTILVVKQPSYGSQLGYFMGKFTKCHNR